MSLYFKLFKLLEFNFQNLHMIGYDHKNYQVTFGKYEGEEGTAGYECIYIDYKKPFSETTGESSSVSLDSVDNQLLIPGFGPIIKIDENSLTRADEIANLIRYVLHCEKTEYDNNLLIEDDFDK